MKIVECRDRPSQGPAPKSWIFELIGRRQELDADLIMAVSTTGFAAGAEELAEKNRIQLRTLTWESVEEAGEWLPANAPLVINDRAFADVQIGFQTSDLQREGDQFPIRDTASVIFTDKSSGAQFGLIAFCNLVVQRQRIDPPTVHSNEPLHRMHVVADEHVLDQYSVSGDGMSSHLTHFSFDIVTTGRRVVMPMVTAASYSNTDGTLVKIGHWKSAEGGPISELMIFGIPKKPTP